MIKKFEGKNIVITGGASGIGRLMVRSLANKGANVIILDINQSNLDTVVNEIRSDGNKGSGYVCDVGNFDAVEETKNQISAEHGFVEILINNAGIVVGKYFIDLTVDEIERTMRVNAMAGMWTTKVFLPEMIEKNRGHLVNIASSAGMVGVAKMTDYAASKFAHIGFDESLRMELKQMKKNINTTIVTPYFINTGMFEGVKSRFSFLLPILDENKVANKIINAIEKKKERVITPPMVYTLFPLRLLPVPVFDWVANFMGINATMKNFVGRGKESTLP
ncbi:MAG: SDR family oxidoreductase [Melioribacteraceae bacterium]|nr:SDR family oxidoreductase [Melioribacteraceae bacterium]